MNIVILSILLPFPLNSGGAQAQYNMIDRLRHKHRITFIFPENGFNHMDAMTELQQRWPEVTFKPYRYVRQLLDLDFLCDKVKRAFNLKFRPNSERFQVERILKPYGYPDNQAFVNFVDNVVTEAKADWLQVEFYPFLQLIPRLKSRVKKIFVHHELRYVRNQRMLADFTLNEEEQQLYEQITNQEISNLNACDKVVTLTDIDKKELERAGVNVPIISSPAAVASLEQPYEGWDGKLIFLGGYSHAPNQEGVDWMLQKVFPLIDWKKYPQAEFHIVGGGWPKRYFQSSGNLPKVVCRGFVSDLPSVIRQSIMLIPILSGSGMRMKILEGAALSQPMLTTTVGVEGLDFRHNESCLIADTPQTYADAIIALMDNDDLRKRLTAEAQHIFSLKYSVKALAERREKIYL